MNRRGYISTAVGALGLPLAGCLDAGAGDASDGSNVSATGDEDGTGPEDAFVALIEAFDEGDSDRADEIVHSESPDRPDIVDDLRDDSDEFADGTWTVSDVEEVERDDERAKVEGVVTTADDDSEWADTVQVEVRREGGEWKHWEFDTGESESVTPTVNFEFEFTAERITITHHAGDTLALPSSLEIVIEGRRVTWVGDADAAWVDEDGPVEDVWAGGRAIIGAGETPDTTSNRTVGFTVESDGSGDFGGAIDVEDDRFMYDGETVQLVWTDESGETAEAIASADAPRE